MLATENLDTNCILPQQEKHVGENTSYKNQ